MNIIHGLSAVGPFSRSVLTIGNFDGVHLAHQRLIGEAHVLAAKAAAPVVVLTFDPHPQKILAPQRAPLPLMPLTERLRILAELGVDFAAVARSEPALLSMDAETFIRDVVWDKFQPVYVVEGPSFGFGRGRKGNPELLSQLAPRYGFNVCIVPSVTVRLAQEPRVVSSSLIRELLELGNIEAAAQCLGRPYALWGNVVRGQERGRTIGFPTANLATADQVIPGDAVYAGLTSMEQDCWKCAISVGPAATFERHERVVEAHLLDFQGDLYGRTLRVDFIARLRDQRRFESTDMLVRQLHEDVEKTQRVLQTPACPGDEVSPTVEDQLPSSKCRFSGGRAA